MGVFKEEASTFEAINFKQVRIFTDAADYGVPYNTKDVPGEVTAVFETLAQLKKLDAEFPHEKKFIRNRQTWGAHDNKPATGVSVDVIIFWEQDEGYDMGTKYTISVDKLQRTHSLIHKDCNAYISVDITRVTEKS
jgi:hypothetical protein